MPPEAHAAFVCAREDTLEGSQRPDDEHRPLLCFDEGTKQVVKDVREPIPAAPGRLERIDYAYERNGTGQCDPQEVCTGSLGACPADAFQPLTTTCTGTSNGGVCDGTDSCDGAGKCVDGFKGAETTCRPAADDCDIAESCSGLSGACPAETPDQCLFREPQITPTGTTCQQYRDSTSADLAAVQYNRKGQQPITSTNPGVFFLYDGIRTEDGAITVIQTNDPPVSDWTRRLSVQGLQIILYDTSCNNVVYNFSSGIPAGVTVDTSNGDVVITGVLPGDYIMSVKYDTGNVVGCNIADCPNSSTTYYFDVDVDGGVSSGSDSVQFTSKK